MVIGIRMMNFNPRSREGSDITESVLKKYPMLFQSTLPRRERREPNLALVTAAIISIHAPAKGATYSAEEAIKVIEISIHAPAKGATIYTGGLAKVTLFQSTLPRRERPDLHTSKAQVVTISIHAPAKGATVRERSDGKGNSYFNPRSREGSDVNTYFRAAKVFLFQSTLPRRERLLWYLLFLPATNFNPRSREGSDWFLFFLVKVGIYFNPRSREGSDGRATREQTYYIKISIHAPAKGATSLIKMVYKLRSFQSTLPRRERPNHIMIHNIYVNFNPRSREGSDHKCWGKITFAYNFNPRSREGSDIFCFALALPADHFNPRSREGSDH